MTADQLAAAIDAYTWLDTQLAVFGPGVILAVGFQILWRATWRTLDRLADAHARLTAARELLADTRAADARPAEDTQPGTDTPPRKETET
ncbi:hypothetical protein ACH4NO_18390 [Streptomyces olivaceus]|uniref:hypothetical protein n=1 Tax=Streptomyces olivaceus TaxID=47716 RepID=UPI0037A4E3A8